MDEDALLRKMGIGKMFSQKIKKFSRISKTNGFFNTLKIVTLFYLQNKMNFPRKVNYRYVCELENSKIKINLIYDLFNVGQMNFPIMETFRDLQYYKSKTGKIVFNLEKGNKVLDIGAFIGDSTTFFALQGAVVYAYEPQKKAFESMLDNMNINGLKHKIHPFNFAVTRDGRSQRMQDNRKASLSFSIGGKGNDVRSSRSFKEILKKEPVWHLVKIDMGGVSGN